MVLQKAMELFYNDLATKIVDGLDRLDHKFEKGAAERWIWELLQNAKDCCNPVQSDHQNRSFVKVEILVTDDAVEFRHSGKPFTIDDINRIVHQTSQKERIEVNQENPEGAEGEEVKMGEQELQMANVDLLDATIEGKSPETTGKFGTGFLTTHMLSRVVEISGIYINAFDSKVYQKFSVTLDRSPRKVDDMIKNYR